MRIDVVGLNLEVTPALREHAELKSQKLLRLFDGVQQITFRLTKDQHHKHGGMAAELTIDVVKHADFVSKAEGDDLYALIDAVVDKGARQLGDFKEKLKLEKR